MLERLQLTEEKYPLIKFIRKNSFYQRLLTLYGIVIVLEFMIFKYLYPYPNFIHGDSFVYLDTAFWNFHINTHMVGYSKFLRLVSVFITSDTALVSLQYIIIHISALYLLFSIFYFFRINRTIHISLLCFMALNPLILNLANLISSDGYFLALSMFWFAHLLWIIHNPNTIRVVVHALILAVTFSVRYNALIYPVIFIIAIGISKLTITRKVLFSAIAILPCALFVLYTSYQYKKLTSHWQYSPFSGWQIANNAMYAYRFVEKQNRKPVNKKYERLDSEIRNYFDTTRDLIKNPQEALKASTVYMWDSRSPLNTYSEMNLQGNKLKKWAAIAPFYRDYGTYIIGKYPLEYFKYFILPNAIKYFAPPTEFVGIYNSNKDSVEAIARLWFEYESQNIISRTKDKKITIVEVYPLLSGFINMVFLGGMILFFTSKKLRCIERLNVVIAVVGATWLFNLGFSVFASSVALRYQTFPLFLTVVFTLVLSEWIFKMESSRKIKLDPNIRNEFSI